MAAVNPLQSSAPAREGVGGCAGANDGPIAPGRISVGHQDQTGCSDLLSVGF